MLPFLEGYTPHHTREMDALMRSRMRTPASRIPCDNAVRKCAPFPRENAGKIGGISLTVHAIREVLGIRVRLGSFLIVLLGLLLSRLQRFLRAGDLLVGSIHRACNCALRKARIRVPKRVAASCAEGYSWGVDFARIFGYGRSTISYNLRGSLRARCVAVTITQWPAFSLHTNGFYLPEPPARLKASPGIEQ